MYHYRLFRGFISEDEVLLIALAIIYGGFFVNYIDLRVAGDVPGYHLYLLVLYAIPFIPVLILKGDISLFVLLYMITSLMNDLLYAPMAVVLTGFPSDRLAYAIEYQFTNSSWYFDMGYASIPVTGESLLLSVIARILIIALISYERYIKHV
ncbi:MAG: hypothetical protein DRN78_00180 [Thermoproteota archaeon]|nr:MAG: hypothetical protein DRN78_00180 [Candidatus Korarchaeota archaeon]